MPRARRTASFLTGEPQAVRARAEATRIQAEQAARVLVARVLAGPPERIPVEALERGAWTRVSPADLEARRAVAEAMPARLPSTQARMRP